MHQTTTQVISNESQRPGGSGPQRNTVAKVPQLSEAPSQGLPKIQPHIEASSSIAPNLRASRPSPINTTFQPSRSTASNAPRPPRGTSQNLADAPATFQTFQELRSPSFPLTSVVSQQPHGSSERPGSRNGTLHAAVTLQPVQIQQGSREQLSSPSPVLSGSSPGMTFEQPPLPASVLLPTQNQSNPHRSSAPTHPNKRQRIHVPMPSLKSRVALINAHVESVGGFQYLNNHLERPRFQLLSDACNTEDLFYVALHQLFCIWDSPGRATIASFEGVLQGIPSTPILADAFKVLGQLIRDNEGLAPNHLKWFIDFPSPLSDLVRTSEIYRNVLSGVGWFLSKLASEWSILSRLCVQRGYPPLIDELMHRMGLPSDILQQIMFTATRRNLGVNDDRYGEQMEKVFNEDRRGHRELAARFNTGRPPTAKEIEKRNETLVEKYLTINNQRIYARRISGSAAGSPLAGSPIVQSQANLPQSKANYNGNMPYQPQRQNSHPAQTQDLSVPDSWHHMQQGQDGRTISTASPHPLLQAVAGRPPSGMGHQGYPSPTLLHGLSINSPNMQSPVQQQQTSQWSAPAPVLRSNIAQNPAQPTMGLPDQIQNGPVPTSRPQGGFQTQQHAVSQHQVQQLQQMQQQQLATHTPHWQNAINPPLHQRGQQANQALQLQLQHMEQQRQQLVAPSVLSMNLAAQSQTNVGALDTQQHVHSRNSSTSRVARQAPVRNSLNVPLPRPPFPMNNPSLVAQNHAVQLYNSTAALQRSLVPPLGFTQPSQSINPDMTALHQAHVRSPRLVLEGTAPDVPEDDPSRRFYQSVKDFALGPIKIGSSALSIFEFSISDSAYALIARNKVTGVGHSPVRGFKSGSLQYRLRCTASKRETTKSSVPDWVISDTVWPETAFLEINSYQLEIRRKAHHGKDLPIDITGYIISKSAPGSVNRIKVSIPRLRKGPQDTSYFIGVEVVEFLQHPQIMEMCTQSQRIPLSKTLDAIKKSLAPPPSDDDDFAMVVSDLSIDLADPFTARIFEIPVRGSSCLHRECFDLETFLLTRNSKPKRPNQPSMIDVWKCPLCGKDARPYSLQVDNFLASVRAELAKQDNLDTKAILISADGSWRAKPEQRATKRKATGDVSDDESSDGESTARMQQAVARKNNPSLNVGGGRASREVEVIELDDD